MNKVEAIVLRTVDYGETHKILTLYSAQMGKIAALARGAKKPRSDLAAVCQPFTYGTFLLYIGERQGMGTISQAEVLDSFRAIREDLFKAAYASYVAELTDRFCAEREPSPSLFLLLSTVLHYLTDEDKDPEVLVRLYETKMLDLAGIRPELYHCAHCFRPVDKSIRFSILHGGPLCGDCHSADERAVWMKPVTLKLMQTFQGMDVRRLGQTRVGDDVKRQLNKILRQYLDEYSGVQFRSRGFLDQLYKYEI